MTHPHYQDLPHEALDPIMVIAVPAILVQYHVAVCNVEFCLLLSLELEDVLRDGRWGWEGGVDVKFQCSPLCRCQEQWNQSWGGGGGLL